MYDRRQFLKLASGAIATAIVSPLELLAGQNPLHSIPPISGNGKYALFRSANYNEVLDSMDALVAEYNTQLDAFNALKLAAVPNTEKNRRHFLVGNGRILAVTQDYQTGFGGTAAFDFAEKNNIPVYVHALDMDKNKWIDKDSEVTETYFFLDKQFAVNTIPAGAVVLKITPEGKLHTLDEKPVEVESK